MRPSSPEPGLVLVHHVAQGDLLGALVGNLEAWGQWGSSGELSACHAEAIYDETRIAKMNPKVSCLYPADQAPWGSISCLRLDLSRYAALGAPQFPGQDPAFVAAFKKEVDAHLGESYGWGQIFRFSWIGLLARIWPAKAQQLLAAKNPNAMADGHEHVCTQWLTDRIENAVKATYPIPDYDLFAGTNVGDGEERPADYIKSLDLKQVES